MEFRPAKMICWLLRIDYSIDIFVVQEVAWIASRGLASRICFVFFYPDQLNC